MKIRKTILPLLICLTLSACNTAAVTPEAEETSNYSETSQTELQTVTEAEETEAETVSVQTVTSAPIYDSDVAVYKKDINFTPILTEDDIEYMGIPYKDLTPEQFIQLWAQATREWNVQRLFVLTCRCNNDTDLLCNEYCWKVRKREAEDNTKSSLVGAMNSCYYDVELIEDSNAPEGYYDSENPSELKYVIKFRERWYSPSGDIIERNDNLWITLYKKNDCWKMRSMATSPNFLEIPAA
ncbi:MAG: hypothetical protein NC203_06400 [Firmicutes bacterium]|nr:hypothetical protein [[Eubacterium] siraeum]MCM1487977.1 hypothetical protein [Bacillota bacterium]